MTLAVLVAAIVTQGTVVMVHGAGGGGWEYDFWKPVFQQTGWKVVAKDLVPVGGDYAKTTFADYQHLVEGWGQRAKRPLVLVGASMGGPLCLKAAEKLKPDAIVLVNSVAPAAVPVDRKLEGFPAVVKWANGPIEDTRAAMPDSDEKTIRWAWKRWRDESGAVMGSLKKGVEVQKPQCPVLVVLGEDDTDVPLATGRAIAKAYGADVMEYAKTSHVGPLMGRRAKEIAGAVAAWLGHRLRR
ncbi:MAG: alpha/beta fold hydrolase [Armatimonadetes bacterium]|nr:alpha/beta fold hydrolase [Armatimonadota bacterium]